MSQVSGDDPRDEVDRNLAPKKIWLENGWLRTPRFCASLARNPGQGLRRSAEMARPTWTPQVKLNDRGRQAVYSIRG